MLLESNRETISKGNSRSFAPLQGHNSLGFTGGFRIKRNGTIHLKNPVPSPTNNFKSTEISGPFQKSNGNSEVAV